LIPELLPVFLCGKFIGVENEQKFLSFNLLMEALS